MFGVVGVDISCVLLFVCKVLLKDLIGEMFGILVYSDYVCDYGLVVFEVSGEVGFEGIVSKCVDVFYVNVCLFSWVKVKYENIDEFLVVGYIDLKGVCSGFGLLLMVMFDKGGLCYVGCVGIGFDDVGLVVLY